MDNEELKEFSRCLSGLDDASKRLLLFKLVETAYEGEEHTHVNVSPLVAYKMSSESFCQGGAWIFFILLTQILSLLLPE